MQIRTIMDSFLDSLVHNATSRYGAATFTGLILWGKRAEYFSVAWFQAAEPFLKGVG